MINWLAAFMFLGQSLFPLYLTAHLPWMQGQVEVKDAAVSYRFGEQILFQATLQTDANLQEVLLFITPEGQPTVWQKVTPDEEKHISQTIDVRQLALQPFSEVTYRYQITLEDGQVVTSPTFSFQYEDNRFDWQTREENGFQVYWYSRDAAFGQEVLNVTQQGLEQAHSILAVEPPTPIQVYVYTSSRDLQSALQVDNQPWIAGHAAPDLGQILISIPNGPEQKLELERQIPHEIMHLLQYQVVGSDFRHQPVWLMEGMASLAELYPNPEYSQVLSGTRAQDLLTINSLCSVFPREASGAFLAYAESESFVRFLYQKYGASGLQDLIGQYQNGLGCEEGISAAYDRSLSQLENQWKQEVLGINTGMLVLSNLSPYLLLAILLMIPASLALYPYTTAKKTSQEEN